MFQRLIAGLIAGLLLTSAYALVADEPAHAAIVINTAQP